MSKPFRIIVPFAPAKAQSQRCALPCPQGRQFNKIAIASQLRKDSLLLPRVAFLQSSGAYGRASFRPAVFAIAPFLLHRKKGALLFSRNAGPAYDRTRRSWQGFSITPPRRRLPSLFHDAPNHLGGYHFARPRLNHSIELPSPAFAKVLCCECLLARAKTRPRYDSDETPRVEQLQDALVLTKRAFTNHELGYCSSTQPANKENRALCCPRPANRSDSA